MVQHKERPPKSCRLCLVKFHATAFANHLKTLHVRQCPCCSATCTASNLHIHLLRCQELGGNGVAVEGLLRCRHCGSFSSDGKALGRHERKQHDRCPCGSFALRSEMASHLLNCLTCEAAFSEPSRVEGEGHGLSLFGDDGNGMSPVGEDVDGWSLFGEDEGELSSSWHATFPDHRPVQSCQPLQQPPTPRNSVLVLESCQPSTPQESPQDLESRQLSIPRNDTNTAIEAYMAAAEAAIERSLDLVQDLAAKAQPGRRLASDLESFRPLIQSVTVGTPITATDYSLLLSQDQIVGPTDKFVVCSMDEARAAFRASPRLPVLIPQVLSNSSPGDRLSLDAYMRLLLGKKTIDVHDFNAELDTEDAPRYPTSMTPQAALDRLERSGIDDAPVNFLNLHGFKENPVPKCLANAEEYNILRQFGLEAGKASKPVSRDLYESTVFQLLAGKGAFHLPHIDRHGVITTVFKDVGEKLWLCWPGLPLRHLATWADVETVPGHGIGIYMQPGDTFIQPAGMLHAPFSMTTVLMTGTMHWHAGSMAKVLELSRFEMENPQVTNEPPSSQFQVVVENVMQDWARHLQSQKGGVTMYGAREQLQSCQKSFEWFKLGCNCKGKKPSSCNSFSSKCTCRKNKKKCDGRCTCCEDCHRRGHANCAESDESEARGVDANAKGVRARTE